MYICIYKNDNDMKNKEYVIESKGFKSGIGSNDYSNKRKSKLEQIKKQIAELEKLENSNKI